MDPICDLHTIVSANINVGEFIPRLEGSADVSSADDR